MLRTIITSKTRRRILELYFHNPKNQYYLRKIVRITGQEVNAVKRELDILSNGKILQKEPRQNKVFYTLNKSYRFYDDFLRLFTKTSELAALLYEKSSKIGKIKFAVVSTAFPKKDEIQEDEIYLLLVGVIVPPEIVTIMKKAEKSFGREINYTIMTTEEFSFRKKNNDPLFGSFLNSPK